MEADASVAVGVQARGTKLFLTTGGSADRRNDEEGKMALTMMKRVGAALAATAFGAAAPAMAQGYGYGWNYGYAPAAYGYGGWDAARALHDREDRIGGWIRSARDSGRIGGWQADRAFGDLQRVRDDERRARWSQDGRLRGDQVARLNDRLSLIADHLRLDRDRDAAPPRWW